jgi:5-(carboxyamino)imidazole ribonucleotide mutase
MALVAVVMGSQSDQPVMQECTTVLDQFGVTYEIIVASAHRTPDAVRDLARGAHNRGFRVMIAGAGGAAALPGVIKSHTHLPVIGVPLASSELKGIDALYAIVQMPPGVPVATMAVGAWGARNAAFLAIEILALEDDALRARYVDFREERARSA